MIKRVLCLLLFLLITVTFCSCKSEDPVRTVKNNSYDAGGETYSEYLQRVEKEKQERIDKVKNAEWRSHPNDYKLIAFTFDDAPSYSTATYNNTATIIDALNKYEGAGTLFVTGKAIENNGTGLLYQAMEYGFEIANHTYNHYRLDKISKDEIKKEITSLNDLVYEQLGVKMKYVRAGELAINNNVLAVSKELGMPIIHTSKTISTRDYDEANTADDVKTVILNCAYDGAIVLCHGWSSSTAGCIEEVCKTLYERGYRFVTVSELFSYKGITDIPLGKVIADANF